MTQYRWLIVAIGFFAIIINYLDRTALSYAITPLEQTFGLTNADFGIIASAFGMGYLAMTLLGGILVDHYGARKVWFFSVIIWSGACALLGFATGFAWFFIFRLILGLAEGPNFPALMRVDADWLPVSERATALAIGLAAVPFASVLGAPLISHLIDVVGWRLMFVTLASFGFIWAFIWLKIFHDKPAESKHVSKEELNHIQKNLDFIAEKGHSLQQQKLTWRFMLFNNALMVNNYAFFVFGYLVFFAINWLPGYLEQVYGVKIKEAGWFLVAPWLLSTVLVLSGGVISDYVWRRTHSLRQSRSHLIWICQALSAICFIPIIFHPTLTMAIISISFGLGFGMMPNAAFYAINADLARKRVGTSLGIMDSLFALAGILAPLLTGILSTVTGNFVAAFSLLIILTFTSVIAIILWQHAD